MTTVRTAAPPLPRGRSRDQTQGCQPARSPRPCKSHLRRALVLQGGGFSWSCEHILQLRDPRFPWLPLGERLLQEQPGRDCFSRPWCSLQGGRNPAPVFEASGLCCCGLSRPRAPGRQERSQICSQDQTGKRGFAPRLPSPSPASALTPRPLAVPAQPLCPSPCPRPSVTVVSFRSLCVCRVVLFCLSLCPLSCLVGSVFQKKIVGMALTKRTVQNLPVSA